MDCTNSLTTGIYDGRRDDVKLSTFSSDQELMDAMRERVTEDIAELDPESKARYIELMKDEDLLRTAAVSAVTEERQCFEYQKEVHGEDYFKTYTCYSYQEDEDDGIMLSSQEARWKRLKMHFTKRDRPLEEAHANGDEQLGFELWKLDQCFTNDSLSYAVRVWTNAMKWRW